MFYNSKSIFRFSLLLLLSLAFVTCEEEDNNSPTSNNLNVVSDFLINNNGLIITLFTDDGENETYYFDSYQFVFHTDETVTATNAIETVNGTYSVFRDDGRIELRMNFPNNSNNPNFNELNDDWYFISLNQNKIRFDDSGDILEFQQQ